MGYYPFSGSCHYRDFWFPVTTMSLCRDRSWSRQDFSCCDSVFRVATEIAQARIFAVVKKDSMSRQGLGRAG